MKYKEKEFWEDNLCGSWFIQEKYLTKDFFDNYMNFRYTKEYHIKKLIKFDSAREKHVLEIGLGVGADSLNWAKFAKSYTGIDITNESVKSVKTLFKNYNIKGSLSVGNIVSGIDDIIKDKKFDIIYSHGVLHHTSNILLALNNLNKYLNDNGELIIMLYSKNSFNYWFRIQFYFRILFIVSLFKYKIGLRNNKLWNSHIKNYYKIGFKYFSWKTWPHHCTDGPDCNIANIYTTKEIEHILLNAKFDIVSSKKAHFPITGTKYKNFETMLAKYIGFYQYIWAIKK